MLQTVSFQRQLRKMFCSIFFFNGIYFYGYIVSLVAKRYTRGENGTESLVVCLSEYLPLHIVLMKVIYSICLTNTEYAGLEITVNSCIASPFSRQIAIGNAGPGTALESKGAKPSFRCHFLNIGRSYKQ